MNENTKLITIILLLVGAFFGDKIIEVVKNNIPEVSTPDVLVSDPSIEYKDLVQPLQQQIITEKVTKMKKLSTPISNFFWRKSQGNMDLKKQVLVTL